MDQIWAGAPVTPFAARPFGARDRWTGAAPAQKKIPSHHWVVRRVQKEAQKDSKRRPLARSFLRQNHLRSTQARKNKPGVLHRHQQLSPLRNNPLPMNCQSSFAQAPEKLLFAARANS